MKVCLFKMRYFITHSKCKWSICEVPESKTLKKEHEIKQLKKITEAEKLKWLTEDTPEHQLQKCIKKASTLTLKLCLQSAL